MAAWHRSWKADVGIRLSGLACCEITYAALACLLGMLPLAESPGALAYSLAAVSFLSASAGSAMACLGHHLFDEVEISSRWQ